MRVLHFVKTSLGGHWALEQMTEMVRQGIEVHAAVPLGGPLSQRYMDSGIIVHDIQPDLPVATPWKFPRLRTRLRNLVKEVAPDLIHNHFVGPTISVRLALGPRHPIPRIFSVPGPLHMEHALTRSLDVYTSGPRDYWAGGCRWTRKAYIKAGIPENRAFLGWPSKDSKPYVPGGKGTLRAELGLPDTTFIIGMVAFMYPPKRYLGYQRGIKGHEDLIDAIALLLSQIPDLKCVMVGGVWNNATEYAERIRAYAKKRCGEHVIFLGTRSDVADLYPDFNAVVHPSHSENMGGAGESLLLGIPTVATNVGGFPDIVRHEETGFLVPPKNPQAIVDTILRIYRDPEGAKAMALRGREIVQMVCEPRRNTELMIQEYHRILREVSA